MARRSPPDHVGPRLQVCHPFVVPPALLAVIDRAGHLWILSGLALALLFLQRFARVDFIHIDQRLSYASCGRN